MDVAVQGKPRTAFSDYNVTQKVYVRSRNGKATKIVREHYLRDDVVCGSKLCRICYENPPLDSSGSFKAPVLAENPAKVKAISELPHYVVVDTNVVLLAMDLLESDKVLYDVIVPQTVLEEVRNRSVPVYTRLRALINSGDEVKRFSVFHNEFRYDTYEPRKKGESINDRNDRAIFKCCKWFISHLSQSSANVDVILLSNDRACRDKAAQDGVKTFSLYKYLSLLPNGDELLDLLPSEAQKDEEELGMGVDGVGSLYTNSAQKYYTEYYESGRIEAGLKNHTLYKGNLSVSPYNYLEATVSVPEFPQPVYVIGRENMNRAFNGDQVVVELLPEDQWRIPEEKIVQEDDKDAERAEIVDSVEQLDTKPASQPTAKVVGVLKRSWRFYVGQIIPRSVSNLSGNAPQSVLVMPMDRSIPQIRIRTRQAANLLGQRIVVAVDDWPTTSKRPEGHFARALGAVESEEAETEALLLEHDVEYRPFSAQVLKCLPKEGHDWRVPTDLEEAQKTDPLLVNRKDFRDRLVCSIDPPGCVDIDDALHARCLPDGSYEVGVHIADVTHFVKPGTPLDAEGASRGTSVYLVDRRIDMLPMMLGTDLCSLRADIDRYAFSVIWNLDKDANIISVTFNKSIIRSRAAFSYEEAQKRIDDVNDKSELTESMRILLNLSKKLKQKRLDAGALNLASPEVKVYMDSETADPSQVEIKKLLATNSLVEEFMLLANISVARKIQQAFPQTAMLRRHAAPPAVNFELLNKELQVRKNLSISLESSKALAESLDRCVDPEEPYFNTLVRIMSTRCMMAAEYFAAGNYTYGEYRHYGLAVDIYTHFTSPIRRYADVVAHRQLAAAIGYEQLDISHRDKSKMDRITANINKRHRNAQFAGRASIEYYVGQVMKQQESINEGFVIRVFSNGIVVLVPKYGVEGLIRSEQMGTQCEFSEDEFTLSFVDTKNTPRQVAVFDKVNVKVQSVLDEVTGKRKVQLALV